MYWSACAHPGNWVVMYTYVIGIDAASVRTIFQLDFGTMPTVWYFCFFIYILLLWPLSICKMHQGNWSLIVIVAMSTVVFLNKYVLLRFTNSSMQWTTLMVYSGRVSVGLIPNLVKPKTRIGICCIYAKHATLWN